MAGAGMSGRSLALECARRPAFRDKKILLIDRDEKKQNDRTWCFWSLPGEPVPPVVYKYWDRCLFFGERGEQPLEIAPYRYAMVRGIDFYEWTEAEFRQYPNVQIIRAGITGLDAATSTVRTDQGDFQGEWVFNSAFTKKRLLPDAGDLWPTTPFTAADPDKASDKVFTRLLQHFKGWVIETATDHFDPAVMTFMDYRIPQKGETRFAYVLPFSEKKALIEFTVFSEALCAPEEYERELSDYIGNILNIDRYKILETEFGIIPMTDDPFSRRQGRVFHIGTAGGFVKASSGYAFKRTQRKLREFADAWELTGAPDERVFRSHWRFRFYDSVMLRVLRDQAVSGKAFFSDLFGKLPPQLVFRFLDEDSTFADELRLLSAPPAWPFFRSALKQIPVFLKI